MRAPVWWSDAHEEAAWVLLGCLMLGGGLGLLIGMWNGWRP